MIASTDTGNATGTTAPPATQKTAFRIGIVCASQRPVRAGPQITDFVQKTIERHQRRAQESNANDNGSSKDPTFTWDLVDVAALGLPLLDEPGIPSRITDASGYAHEHTRRWSRRVAALDAFVFVSPQYNWGIPAGLKNALDYLYNEWVGKPAAVVTYGGHGGDKCEAQLRVVLGGGLRMRLAGARVNLTFPDREVMVKGATGRDMGLDAERDDGVWSGERAAIAAAWDEVVGLLKA